MVIRGVASSSLDGLRSEGPGTAVAVRKLRRRGHSLPHIFLGRLRPTRSPKGARARGWGMMGRTVTGIKVQGGCSQGQRSWGQGGSWNWEDMESHDCVAMESQVRGQEEGWIPGCLSASVTNSMVGSHRGCRSLVGSPCPNSRASSGSLRSVF